MATKNILSCLIGLSFLFVLTACPAPIKTNRQAPPDRQTDPGEPQEIVKPTNQPPQIERPEFLQKEAPKLGIILGPGGALSYAHIGFLQELENNKIPVTAIAGIEWGALVAGAYAQTNKSHSIEWKLLKLPTKKFNSKGFFSSGDMGSKVTNFDSFLNDVFGNSDFSDLEIPFVCPYVHIANGKSSLRRNGKMKHAVRSCWPMSPHFKVEVVGANPIAVADVARALRREGAEVILYVDVLGQTPMLDKKFRLKFPKVARTWLAQKKLVDLLKQGAVDQVLTIGLGNSRINSYGSLRSIIRMGQVKSKSTVKGLVKQYAF